MYPRRFVFSTTCKCYVKGICNSNFCITLIGTTYCLFLLTPYIYSVPSILGTLWVKYFIAKARAIVIINRICFKHQNITRGKIKRRKTEQAASLRPVSDLYITNKIC